MRVQKCCLSQVRTDHKVLVFGTACADVSTIRVKAVDKRRVVHTRLGTENELKTSTLPTVHRTVSKHNGQNPEGELDSQKINTMWSSGAQRLWLRAPAGIGGKRSGKQQTYMKREVDSPWTR